MCVYVLLLLLLLFCVVVVVVVVFSKISLDILYEKSAEQTIHIKCQVFFSLINNTIKKNRMSSATILLSVLRVNLEAIVGLLSFKAFNKMSSLILCEKV